MTTDLILGTAGHIDHGKTSLIKALTGVDTDRLPEEKRRGITIDLGFAELIVGDFRLGIVDVPGHERFVRNMLAGATGMDLALLVVAADDSIKPQTLEHLEILRLLELPAGVIALTKCDLVDSDWLAIVEDEVRQLVAGSFLQDAPIVPTSATTGQGLDELKGHLERSAAIAATHRRERSQAPFRMAIDRVFSIAGHGVVVTGSVSTGRASVGDELEVQPGNLPVRVRGLHSFDRVAETVHRGQRAAINLAGVKHEDLHRGHELAAVHHLQPTRLITAQIHLSDDARPLKNRARCRLHLGAAEFLARVKLLEGDRVAPGQKALVQFFLDHEAVATWRQPFVLRSESPVTTIGGGIVIDPQALPLRKTNEQELQKLRDLLSADPLARASASLYFIGLRAWQPTDLSRTAGIDQPDGIVEQLVRRGDLISITISAQRTIRVHRDILERYERRLEMILDRLHDQQPLAISFDQSRIAHRFAFLGDEAVFHHLVKSLELRKVIHTTPAGIGLSRRGPQLSQNEQKLFRQLLQWYREGGFEAPSLSEVKAKVTKNQASVPELIEVAVGSGDLAKISDDYFLHADVDREVRANLAASLKNAGGVTMSQIRDILKTSRKYAVPYCEYLDRIGFTRRDGDLRFLADEGQRQEVIR